ncbi:hypothetical protein [Amycolatopsis sp. NPDC050768]|uniref:hypothetical protein n=1 Tax=Amycolatopsis sp. NPDC050768 TaxID=3154839 RepID=UPI0033D00E69
MVPAPPTPSPAATGRPDRQPIEPVGTYHLAATTPARQPGACRCITHCRKPAATNCHLRVSREEAASADPTSQER